MKLFVTGAGGFVGAAVIRQAVEAGHQITGVIRPNSSRTRLHDVLTDIRIVSADLRDTQTIEASLSEAKPDVIIHVAWSGVSNAARHNRLQMTDNIDTSCSLLDAGIAAGVEKFVGIGSQGEYGLLDGKISERDLPEPTSLYGAAKLAVLHLTRQLAAQAEVSFAWMRLFSTFGPGDNPNWLIPSLIEEMLKDIRPKTTLGTQRWDYLYIDDVATGILAAAVKPEANGIFNLGSGKPIPVREIVEIIGDLAAPDMEIIFGERPYPLHQIWHMEADIARLRNETGWEPQIELREGLARTVEWHRQLRSTHAARDA